MTALNPVLGDAVRRLAAAGIDTPRVDAELLLADLLGISRGALRGRDVNRPTDDDLAEAERDVVLVRRHWKPPPA